MLKVNYTIDPAVRGTATLRTVVPLTRSQLLPTLQALLAQTGGTMTYQNGLFEIAPTGEDTVAPVIDSASYGVGTQAVPLRYASAKTLGPMLEPIIGDTAKLVADPARNILVVSGPAAARANVIDLIKIFDVDSQ
jgi:general secretion pathway protein D